MSRDSAGDPGKPGRQAGRLEAWGKWLLRAAVSAALLAFVIGRTDAGRFDDLVASAHWGWWTAGLAIALLAPLVAAQRSRLLLRGLGYSVSLGSMLAVNLESMFFSIVIPGELVGGVVRWERVSRHTGDRIRALILLVAERLIDWIVLASLVAAGASLLYGGEAAPRLRALTAAGAAAFALLGSAVVLVGRSRSSLRVVGGWHGCRGPRIGTLLGYLERLLAAGRALSSQGRHTVALLLWTLAAWSTSIFAAFVMARAVFPQMPLLPYAAATAAMTLVVQLPLTFAGLGLRELSLPLLLGAYGVTAEVGLLVGLSAFVPFLCLGVAGLVVRLAGRNRLEEDEDGPNR